MRTDALVDLKLSYSHLFFFFFFFFFFFSVRFYIYLYLYNKIIGIRIYYDTPRVLTNALSVIS